MNEEPSVDARFAAMTDAVIRMPRPRQEVRKLKDEVDDLRAHLRAAHALIRKLGGKCAVCAGGTA
jgi:hypothetical protein